LRLRATPPNKPLKQTAAPRCDHHRLALVVTCGPPDLLMRPLLNGGTLGGRRLQMNDKKITSTLLTEAHAAIADAAQAAVAKVGVSLRKVPGNVDTSGMKAADRKMVAAIRAAVSEMTLTYPPEARVLAAGEERALRAMTLTAAERGALQKLVAEACHSTIFRFLCLMDAVGHPEVVRSRTWLGARFTAREEGDMLHDQLDQHYWKYKAAARTSARVKPKAKPKRR
jgi:hypothetical protein